MSESGKRKASNSAPPGVARPQPKSEILGDFNGESPTKRYKNEMNRTPAPNGGDFEHHLDHGKNPTQVHEGRAKDPVPCNE